MTIKFTVNRLFSLIILLVALAQTSQADPVAQSQAWQAARGWLKYNPMPMDYDISGNIRAMDEYKNDSGQVLYYTIHLEPEGFMVLAGDDRLEPVIVFAATGDFNTDSASPLTALLQQDMADRLAVAVIEPAGDGPSPAMPQVDNAAQEKWQRLLAAGYEDPNAPASETVPAGLSSVSDVRVAPLLQTKWGQGEAAGDYCYNYYTPNHYVTGCVATAFAQVLRYHAWPAAGIGVKSCAIQVDSVPQNRTTRGGNGSGGPYNWAAMIANPEGGITTAQRQAIGALCYDAGLTVGMNYTTTGSGAGVGSANDALKQTFGYSNSVFSNSFSHSGDAGLWTIINSNLDAAAPVLLGIGGPGVGHAVVADGYGYNDSAIYHHLNMGWGGLDDLWYQLPVFTAGMGFDAINDCVYNIYPQGTGEIVSGRIVSMAGLPLEGVTVSAHSGGVLKKQALTNNRGVYALKNLPGNTSYLVSAAKSGYAFADQYSATGLSQDWNAASGNRWGVNFTATNPMPPLALDGQANTHCSQTVTIIMQAIDDHLPNPPGKISYVITTLPAYGRLMDPGVGAIQTVPYTLSNYRDTVQYRPCPYFGGIDSFGFRASDGGSAPTGGLSNVATVTVTIDNTISSGFGENEGVGTNTMINTTRYASRSQALYLAGEIGPARYITDLELDFTGLPPLTLKNWTIRMQHTTMSYYDDVVGDFLTSGWTKVYQGDLTVTQTGWYKFHFSAPFKYNGTQNLLIEFTFNNSSISGNTGWYLFKDTGMNRVTTIVTSNSTHTDPLTWDFWYGGGSYWGGGWLPSIKVTGTVPLDPLAGDLNRSCAVDLPDLALLSSAWLTSKGQTGYNSAYDIALPLTQINLQDLILLADHWLEEYAW